MAETKYYVNTETHMIDGVETLCRVYHRVVDGVERLTLIPLRDRPTDYYAHYEEEAHAQKAE